MGKGPTMITETAKETSCAGVTTAASSASTITRRMTAVTSQSPGSRTRLSASCLESAGRHHHLPRRIRCLVTMITETLNWIHDLPVAATDKPRSYYKMHSIHAYIIHKIHIWFTFSPMFKYHNMM